MVSICSLIPAFNNLKTKIANILQCYALGMEIKQISRSFELSCNTVHKYVRLFQKCGIPIKELASMPSSRIQEMFSEGISRFHCQWPQACHWQSQCIFGHRHNAQYAPRHESPSGNAWDNYRNWHVCIHYGVFCDTLCTGIWPLPLGG